MHFEIVKLSLQTTFVGQSLVSSSFCGRQTRTTRLTAAVHKTSTTRGRTVVMANSYPIATSNAAAVVESPHPPEPDATTSGGLKKDWF